ncbi:dTMP kinase [bacterium]|nr:dTMP kinase [bacterium]
MFFLAFEGLDGSGKSTLMSQLESHLRIQNKSFIKTREPGGTLIGDQLRNIILSKGAEVPSPRTELLLYEASRSQHVDLVIKPALEKKQWVLCDRFTASSVAFQAGGRQISGDQVDWLNDFATDSLKPNLNVLLDLTIEESQRRRQSRAAATGETEDRMESEAESFHRRVREGFLKQAEQHPTDWLVLDASKTPEELFNLLLTELKSRKWLE